MGLSCKLQIASKWAYYVSDLKRSTQKFIMYTVHGKPEVEIPQHFDLITTAKPEIG